MHKDPKHIIAFRVGNRSGESVKALWKKYPQQLDKIAFFILMVGQSADADSYKTVIPQEQHLYCEQKKDKNHIERFNRSGGLQYVASKHIRFRKGNALFPKKLENHIGAIKFYLSCHNLNHAMELLAP